MDQKFKPRVLQSKNACFVIYLKNFVNNSVFVVCSFIYLFIRIDEKYSIRVRKVQKGKFFVSRKDQ